jgi:hypothetical protein
VARSQQCCRLVVLLVGPIGPIEESHWIYWNLDPAMSGTPMLEHTRFPEAYAASMQTNYGNWLTHRDNQRRRGDGETPDPASALLRRPHFFTCAAPEMTSTFGRQSRSAVPGQVIQCQFAARTRDLAEEAPVAYVTRDILSEKPENL